jgi:hypothetical protein
MITCCIRPAQEIAKQKFLPGFATLSLLVFLGGLAFNIRKTVYAGLGLNGLHQSILYYSAPSLLLAFYKE